MEQLLPDIVVVVATLSLSLTTFPIMIISVTSLSAIIFFEESEQGFYSKSFSFLSLHLNQTYKFSIFEILYFIPS